jgi:hypothetical protein
MKINFYLKPYLLFWSVTASSLAETRLLGSWQEYWVSARAANGGADPKNYSGDAKSTSGIPGQRSLIVSSEAFEGLGHTLSYASVQQRAGTIVNGIAAVGTATGTGRGIYPSSRAFASTVIDFEITGNQLEPMTVSYNLSGQSDKFFDNYISLQWSALRRTSIGMENYGSGTMREGQSPLTFAFPPGKYRFTIGPQIWLASYDKSQTIQYDYRVIFQDIITQTGASQSQPFSAANNSIFEALPSARWFSAAIAEKYLFRAEIGTSFEEIMSFPEEFGSNFHIYVNGLKIGEKTDGESFDFKKITGSSVVSFEIRNVKPQISGQAQASFPIMLRFSQDIGSFSMMPILAPFTRIEPLPNGAISINFSGILQQSNSMLDNSWTDLDPQPASPLVIPKESQLSRSFYRVRTQ